MPGWKWFVCNSCLIFPPGLTRQQHFYRAQWHTVEWPSVVVGSRSYDRAENGAPMPALWEAIKAAVLANSGVEEKEEGSGSIVWPN